MRAARFLIFVVVTAVAAGLAAAPPAGAHSTLIRACPGPGDVLNEVEILELEFTTPLIDDDIGRVDLLESSTERLVAVGPPVFSEDLLFVTVTVDEELNPGPHIVRYRVTSADGDENDGGFEFSYDPDAEPDSDTCEIIEQSNRAGGLVLLGVGVVAVGALLFFLRPRKASPAAAG